MTCIIYGIYVKIFYKKIDSNNLENISSNIDNEYCKNIFEIYSHIVDNSYKEAEKYKKIF